MMATVAAGFQSFEPKLIEFLRDLGNARLCFGQFQRLQPLQRWLVELLSD